MWSDNRLNKEASRIIDESRRYKAMAKMILARDKLTNRKRRLTESEIWFLKKAKYKRSTCYGRHRTFDLTHRNRIDKLWKELMG